ncbi:MAG: hypothetical protein WCS70_09590 [Verrucomicrobiota bacterium]
MRRELLIALAALVTGCAAPVHTLRFHEEVPANLPASRVRRVTIPTTGQQICINPYPTIDEKDVHQARLEFTNAGEAVVLQFDAHGTVGLAEMMTRLRGQYFVVLVDEKPVVGILVDRVIKDGRFHLLGNLTDAEALALVESLNKAAGRGPVFDAPQSAP